MTPTDPALDAALDALPPSSRTTLQILRLQGSAVELREDHLVARTPTNPDFYWGNYVQVTTGDVDDASRWAAVHRAEFPGARHIAIGLPTPPTHPAAYAAEGLTLDLDDSLSTRTLPRQLPLPEGYAVRPLTREEDWAASTQMRIDFNARERKHPQDSYAAYISGATDAKRELVEAGHAHFVGAFGPDGALAADLGIVMLGETARYQDVMTHEGHRRRGLAGHLLGVAARWAQRRGAAEWVILTEVDNSAGRVYRSVGFEPDPPCASAVWSR